MRDNALKQASLLMEYKRLFCHHPSHRRQANANKNKNASQQEQQQQQGGIFSVFVSILAEPLSRTGNGRTDADHLTIELVLHLFRNLLAAEPLLNDSATNSEAAETLHHELVSLLDRELVLEILLVLSADIELRENAPYNLLLMELLRLLLRHQDPVRMARSGLAPPRRTPATATARQHHGNTIDGTSSTSSNRTNNSGSLLDSLRREKNNLLASATSRHSNFGGTWVLESGRHRSLVSASLLGQSSRSTTSNTGPNRVDGTGLQRRKSKQTEPFVGAKTKTSMNSENSDGLSPAARRAATTLHSFCKRFVATCYGPVMKSLKNEFRRDSVRLEEGDRVVWFQIVAFFSQWWRTSKELGTLSEEDLEASTECGIGQLIFTMDVFTFNLVLNSADAYLEQKKFGPLAHSVALLGEMLHLLFIMYSSESSSTEHIMAMGLMDRLYYGSDPLDRLPKLISRWTVSTTTRQYLCNLLTEVCHVTLMLLDASAAACSENESSSSQPDATVANMKAMVKEFDVASYFTRKIVSNHFVSMITYLLSQYNINGATVNQRLVDLLERIAQHTLSLGDETSTEDSALTPLAANKVTMEPMLFNVQMLLVLNTILNDSTIRHDSASASLVLFAATTVANFAQMAQENPILYVEALFKYPFPHRYCELVTNNYVTDDLRMLAERDWLLQKQQLQTDQQLIRDSASGSLGEHQAEQETLRNNSSGNNNNNGDEDDESEDEELEFTDIPSPEPLAPQVSKDGDLVDSDDDDSDENDNGESNSNTGQTNMTNVGENDDLDELTTKRDVSTCDWRTSDGSPPPSKVSKQSQELDDKSDEDDDSDL